MLVTAFRRLIRISCSVREMRNSLRIRERFFTRRFPKNYLALARRNWQAEITQASIRPRIEFLESPLGRLSAFSFLCWVGLVLIALLWITSFSAPAAAQGTNQSLKIVRSSGSPSIPSVKPADLSLTPNLARAATEFYAAMRGQSEGSVSRQYLKRTSYLTSSELAEA